MGGRERINLKEGIVFIAAIEKAPLESRGH